MRRIIRKFAQNNQANKHTNRDFKYRGHSNPLWIVGGSGPIQLQRPLLSPVDRRGERANIGSILPWIIIYNRKNVNESKSMDIPGWFKDEVYTTWLEAKVADNSVSLEQGKMQDLVASEGNSMSSNEHR